MKRIISLFLIIITVFSIAVIPANAAGTLVFSDDFEMGFKPINWIQGSSSCNFFWDKNDRCLIGYEDAVVLQPNFDARDAKKWDQFYCSYDFQVRGFDDIEPRDSHSVGMWYRDLFENESGAQGAVYTFFIEIETGKATFCKEHTFDYRDENGILQEGEVNTILGEAHIPGDIEVSEDAPWYEIGMRVDSGLIECYFDQQLVFSFKANPNDEMLGHIALNNVDATVGSQKSPILFWNSGNYIAVDNFEVWTPDYDFIPSIYGDANGDDIVNLNDAVLIMQKIAGWDVELDDAYSDVNLDGIVNIADVVLIMQYAAGWDVVLGSAA